MEAGVDQAPHKLQPAVLPALHVTSLSVCMSTVIDATLIFVVIVASTDRAEEDRVAEINSCHLELLNELRRNLVIPTTTLTCDLDPAEMRTDVTHC